MSSGLYGLTNSNRSGEDHWGKNCFNSSFPTALACYMYDNDIPAIYNKLELIDGVLTVVSTEIPMKYVFNCDKRPIDYLNFRFETIFQPYQEYSFDTIDGIDLVVRDIRGDFLSPLEVKLTVMPDSTTYNRSADQWGCEIVIRSATTSYCALGMFDAINKDAQKVRQIFEDACSSIQSWDNDFEMTHKTPDLSECINTFQKRYIEKQKPLLMQTIWKTQGQSPLLADRAFDIVVWSDYAFSRLFIDNAFETQSTMSRPMRASARLARCLWELSKSGKIRIADIYRQMAFGNQTDKEFSIAGVKWRRYVTSNRIPDLRLGKDVLSKIIAPGYIEELHPERRFDQTLYFTVRGQ